MGFTNKRSTLAAGLAVMVVAASIGTGMALAAGTHQASSKVTVGIKHTSLGSVLYAGPKHLTVYMYTKDHGTKSACNGISACAKFWPAVKTSGNPGAGPGVSASALGESNQGKFTQATYHGHLLYYFADDKNSSAISGQGVEGTWFVLAANGSKITKKASSASASTTSTTTTTTSSGGAGGGWA
jgi:predicted lipoprotein with Yx(FWY)xxD motif